MINLVSGLLSTFAVIVTTLIYYEVLRSTWKWIPKINISPRRRVIFIVLSIFSGHTLAVWFYGFLYWVAVNYLGLGNLNGSGHEAFLDAVYFSAVTYSSLGLGDVVPTGGIRMICGVEVLNGLVLIGWSVSFTYLAMEKFWDEN